jgi:hypothetical protein
MEWIKTKDKLPNNNDEVLIWSQTEAEKLAKTTLRKLRPMAVYYHDGFKIYGTDNNQEWLDDLNITHWMYLPEPPYL